MDFSLELSMLWILATQPIGSHFLGKNLCTRTLKLTFDDPVSRQGLGTHSVPDIEVLSTDPPDLMPLTGEAFCILFCFLLMLSLSHFLPFHRSHPLTILIFRFLEQGSTATFAKPLILPLSPCKVPYQHSPFPLDNYCHLCCHLFHHQEKIQSLFL